MNKLFFYIAVGLIGISTLAVYSFAGPRFKSSAPTSTKVISLYADKSSGRDPAWKKRHKYGLRTWGIRGSHKVESGNIWFDKFPGATGRYRIRLHALLEHDGQGAYRLGAGEQILSQGKFPYALNQQHCGKKGVYQALDLGDHHIEQGSKISLWGESVYQCPEGNGAYTMWERIDFEPL